jgi:hypothetical protein
MPHPYPPAQCKSRFPHAGSEALARLAGSRLAVNDQNVFVLRRVEKVADVLVGFLRLQATSLVIFTTMTRYAPNSSTNSYVRLPKILRARSARPVYTASTPAESATRRSASESSVHV